MRGRAVPLGLCLPLELALAGCMRLQGRFIVLDIHGVVVPLALTILPLQHWMMKNSALAALIQLAAFTFFYRTIINYTHAICLPVQTQ